jgi:predicted ABC-type transport system involved in lysophospholipase L1 biosynthesis ATPase subunit
VAMGEERYVGLDDKALTRLRRERLGFVFQFFNLLPSRCRDPRARPPGAQSAAGAASVSATLRGTTSNGQRARETSAAVTVPRITERTGP